MTTIRLAFDKTARRIDADGRLHVAKSHISKATVNPYYGSEIPGYESLGLNPEKVYKLFRDPVELERGALTFARLPILSEHVPVTVDSPQPDLIIGSIGSDVEFNAPYLDADLCFWDANAIAGVETGKIKELSCAYRYVPIMEAGEFEGQPYDGRMTQIQGNHLALVEFGRAGADVVVSDHNPFKESVMKMTKLGKALFAALCAASPVLAADSALPALVGPATRKNFKIAEVKSKLIALDASLDSNKLDAVLDAILDVEQDPKPVETPMAAADETPAEKIKAMLAGKVDDSIIEQICAMMMPAAEDEFPEDKKDDDKKDDVMKKEDVKTAMDAMSNKLRAEMREANDAARDVRSVVGDVSMDSAADIYGFALDHLKVEHDGIEGVKALRTIFKIAASKSATPAPRIAQDAGSMEKQFPGAARFRNA